MVSGVVTQKMQTGPFCCRFPEEHVKGMNKIGLAPGEGSLHKSCFREKLIQELIMPLLSLDWPTCVQLCVLF